MEIYYALDYVDNAECELVLGDQLFLTEAEAAAAREEMPNKEHIEINTYTLRDLEDSIYCEEIEIGPDLMVISAGW